MIVILDCSFVEDAFSHLRICVRRDFFDSHSYAPDFALLCSRGRRSYAFLRVLLLVLPNRPLLDHWQLFILSDVNQIFLRLVAGTLLIFIFIAILILKSPVCSFLSPVSGATPVFLRALALASGP